jgi:glycosyltransferase involved in cell wall biosynthesis
MPLKLSIITVNLNNAEGLRKTIESVISQTYNDYEYLIIDGGSTDGSVEIIKEFADKITYWVSEPDKGIYNAMNKGILKANGEYLQFLNSGDWLLNEKILYKLFNLSYSAEIIFGNTILTKADGTTYLYLKKPIENISLAYFFTKTIQHQSSFIKKDLFNELLYDDELKIVADWKFFIQKIIIQNCKVLPFLRTINAAS